MAAGQIVNVLICSPTPPGVAAGQLAGPLLRSPCPAGQDAYLISGYLAFPSSQQFLDGLMSPFDPAVASQIFGFGFGLVVFFYLIGLKGSVILSHFWGRRY